ncbi:MAG: hypothetical protein IAE90_10120, partial [Ignavibacteria bacterium]|nr:hypothetical protein [Ignavibacteria bacterium]
MLVIGRNPVTESLKFDPASILKIVLLDSAKDSKINEIERFAKSKNIDIVRLSKNTFEQILDKKDKSEGISQGIIAEVRDLSLIHI